MDSVTIRNDMPTNPVVDLVGCGSETAHGALFTRLRFRADAVGAAFNFLLPRHGGGCWAIPGEGKPVHLKIGEPRA
jgi:hypothetical protein